MKRNHIVLIYALLSFLTVSCAHDIIDLTGSIQGTVKDYNSGKTLGNCQVSLSPGGKSVTTPASGVYEFVDLTPGQYSVVFSKAGYNDEKTTLTVTAGKTTMADALLKVKAPFALSETAYDFGDLEASRTFYFFNYSDADCSFSISNIPSWLSFDKTSGTIKADGNVAVTATVDRSKVEVGSFSQNVAISYSGNESGEENLAIVMRKVVLTIPTVTIGSSAESVNQNAFDISGAVTATGGLPITSYGHCWNTTGAPTIEDSKTDIGSTKALLTFKSTASNLNTYTTYYVRAYAKNAQGVAYSGEISVTTQDLVSDKWDGKLASSFAGGSGTYTDPYIIKTGGQLLLAKDYSKCYFELGGNIDLNGKNWLPYSFEGNIDGKGYTISNLYINRVDDYQGLFSRCSGSVSNLTVNGATINGGSNDCIGAISGNGGTITNCKVILGGSSIITGKDNVGGISGGAASVSECVVESLLKSAAIQGNSGVGGIVGGFGGNSSVNKCSVKCIISGKERVGGIVGHLSGGKVKSCLYEGTITGEDCVGGLIGDLVPFNPVSVEGCKVNAFVTATKGNAGGLIGGYALINSSGVRYRAEVYGCYSAGTISATGVASSLVTSTVSGPVTSNYEINVYLSYSTMTSTSSSFFGLGNYVIGTDCATISSVASKSSGTNINTNCTDITTVLQESYSDYANYWNFDKSWIWQGSIDGKSVEVNCPKLSWE